MCPLFYHVPPFSSAVTCHVPSHLIYCVPPHLSCAPLTSHLTQQSPVSCLLICMWCDSMFIYRVPPHIYVIQTTWFFRASPNQCCQNEIWDLWTFWHIMLKAQPKQTFLLKRNQIENCISRKLMWACMTLVQDCLNTVPKNLKASTNYISNL